jgi:hypothetical protein
MSSFLHHFIDSVNLSLELPNLSLLVLDDRGEFFDLLLQFTLAISAEMTARGLKELNSLLQIT